MHHRVQLLHRPVLADAGACRRVLAFPTAGHNPTHRWQVPVEGVHHKLGVGDDVLLPQWTKPDVADGLERGPDESRLTKPWCVVLPRNSSLLESIGKSREIETGVHEADRSVLVQHLDP